MQYSSMGGFAAAAVLLSSPAFTGKVYEHREAALQFHEKQKQRKRGPVGYRKSYRYKPNGAVECARRMTQILEGRLTVANGLVLPHTAP
jgi:hypothetical protein